MTSVNYYKIFCITENKWVNSWATEPPTTCPNNTADTIIPNSATIENTISESTINVEETAPGFFQSTFIELNIPGSIGDSVHNITFPMDVFINQTGILATTDMLNDKLNIIVSPNTPIGAVISQGNIGDNVVTITPATFNTAYIAKGINIILILMDSSGNTIYMHDAGRIIGFNKSIYQITIENPLTSVCSIGTLLLMNLYITKNVVLKLAPHEYIFGRKGLAKKVLPANTISKIIYTNNNGLAKTIYLTMEYFYH